MEFRVDPGTGQRWVRNVYLHGTLGVDDPVAVYPCDDAACAVIRPLVYAKDHLNSVEALYDVTAQPVVSYGYSTFGVPVGSVPSLQPYTYTARGWEGMGNKDIYYMRARYYSSRAGRFIQIEKRDRLMPKLDLYLIPSTNLYNYTNNQPLIYVDNTGNFKNTVENDGSVKSCRYYEKVCNRYRCKYHCGDAQFYCKNPRENPCFGILARFFNVDNTKIRLIRRCLIYSDELSFINPAVLPNIYPRKRIWSCKKPPCPNCKTIQDYHRACFKLYGVRSFCFPTFWRHTFLDCDK